MVRKSNDTFAFFQSSEDGIFKAIIKLHTKTDASVSNELLSTLNNAILNTHPSTKPKNNLNIDVTVAGYDTEQTTLTVHKEVEIINPDEFPSNAKEKLSNPTIWVAKDVDTSVDELLDDGIYQEGEIISAKWLSRMIEHDSNTWLHVINHAGYYPNEDEVNEIFGILSVEARLDYENLYEGFEEMMCASKPSKELLLRILTRTMKEAAKQLEKIIQEER